MELPINDHYQSAAPGSGSRSSCGVRGRTRNNRISSGSSSMQAPSRPSSLALIAISNLNNHNLNVHRRHGSSIELGTRILAACSIITIAALLFSLLLIEAPVGVLTLVIDKQAALKSQSTTAQNTNAISTNSINNDNQPNANHIREQEDHEGSRSNSYATKQGGSQPSQAHLPSRQDWKRPIWNIAHMVNSIKELDYRLGMGANAVEADVTFSATGEPLYMYHGPPCDCWRHCHQQEDFDDYLSYVHEIAIAEADSGVGRNLSLLFLDLKLDYLSAGAKVRAGRELAASVMRNLYPTELQLHTQRQRPQLATNSRSNKKLFSLIVSINHVTDIELVNNFLDHLERSNASHLMQRIGFDVGMNDDIQQIESMWRRSHGDSLNLWQGDGYTNCISPFYNLQRLSAALQRRDQESGYPRKVYQWTIDLHDRLRESLRLGVDAIMTNHPERLLSVLSEPEISHNFRLATRFDDPFKKVVSWRGFHRAGESARYQRSAVPGGGGFLASLVDVFHSWLAYMREIPFLSLPTTSRFFNKLKRRNFKYRTPIASSGPGVEAGELLAHSTARSFDASTDQQQQQQVIMLPRPSSADMKQTISISTTITISTTTPLPITTTVGSESSNNNETTTTIMISTTHSNPAYSIHAKDSTSPTDADTQQQAIDSLAPYEPPKWYTTFLSNFLVSLLKLALPVNGTSSTSTTSTQAP